MFPFGFNRGARPPGEEVPTTDPVDELYRISPAEFTERRNALAKKVRASGDEETAKEIAALKRPTLAVWAVNQLAAEQPGLVKELLQTQHALREGPSPKELQELSRRRRQLVATLGKRAASILKEAGQSATDQTLKRVSNTLLAANTPQEEELLRRGGLRQELSPSGFEEAFGTVSGPAPTGESGPSRAEIKAEEQADQLAAEAKTAKREADELASEAASLRRQLDAAEESARGARKKAEELARKAKSAAARARRR